MISVCISGQTAKEKVGRGECGVPGMVLSLGQREGDVTNAARGSQSRARPGIPVTGLQQAGADGLSRKASPAASGERARPARGCAGTALI